MKPYYADDLVSLYHGDCEDVLPSLPAIDLTAIPRFRGRVVTTANWPIRLTPQTAAFTRYISPRRRCAVCNRNTPLRKNGRRIKHRTEADNPLAPYCCGDDP